MSLQFVTEIKIYFQSFIQQYGKKSYGKQFGSKNSSIEKIVTREKRAENFHCKNQLNKIKFQQQKLYQEKTVEKNV